MMEMLAALDVDEMTRLQWELNNAYWKLVETYDLDNWALNGFPADDQAYLVWEFAGELSSMADEMDHPLWL